VRVLEALNILEVFLVEEDVFSLQGLNLDRTNFFGPFVDAPLDDSMGSFSSFFLEFVPIVEQRSVLIISL
jgi:hypothetical protein